MLRPPREIPSRPRRSRWTLCAGREKDGCTGNRGPLDGRFSHGAVWLVPLPVRPPRNGEARHPRHTARPPPLFRPPVERPPPALVGRDFRHYRRVVCPVALRTTCPPQVRGRNPFRGKCPACHFHPVRTGDVDPCFLEYTLGHGIPAMVISGLHPERLCAVLDGLETTGTTIGF